MRSGLVALALVILGAAGILAARAEPPPGSAFPSWVPSKLGSLSIRPGAPATVPIERDVAVEVVRRSVFLEEGPESDPLVLPALVSGPVALYPVLPSPTGEVAVPDVDDAPAWLVVWRGLPGDTLERFGDWPGGAAVDAVFLVDGQTGDCCWFTRFLAGGSRLG